MNAALFDFHKSERLPGDVTQRFTGWLHSACTVAGKNWAKTLPFALELNLQGIDVAVPRTLLDRFPETAIGYRMAVSQERVAAMLVLPRPLILALVAGLVGSSVSALPEDRELTLVEETLYEYFLNQYLLPPLKETWPGADALPLEVLQKEPSPRWSRLFPPSEPVAAFSFGWKGPFEEQTSYWLLPKKWLLTQKEPAPPSEQPALVPETALRPQLEASIRPLHLELSVVLGAAELRVSQLAKLRPGDVIILDQNIALPVTGRVAGKAKFRGWPGKKGTRQQVQIESFLD